MGRAERIDVRPLCVRRDLGDMGVFWQYISVTVSDVEMLHKFKGSCPGEWQNSSLSFNQQYLIVEVGYMLQGFGAVGGVLLAVPVQYYY